MNLGLLFTMIAPLIIAGVALYGVGVRILLQRRNKG